MADERTYTISIVAKNVTAEAFGQAKRDAEALADKLGGNAKSSIAGAATESTGALDTMKRTLGSLGIGLSVTAVVGFAKSLLDMGDELVRVSDRTGLTTDEVQKLQFIAKQSGNSLDEMTGSISQLQKRLAGGDDNAAAAVRQLGLNFEQLRTESPYAAMTEIATAIAQIPDPATRAKLAMDLFGRSGAAILPTLVSNFKDLGEQAPRVSKDTAKALDALGDSLSKTWDLTKGFAGTLLVLSMDALTGQGALRQLANETENYAAQVKKAGAGLDQFRKSVADRAAKPLTLTVLDEKRAEDELAESLRKGNEATKTAAEDAKKHAAELAKLTEKVHELEGGLFLIPDTLTKIGRTYDESKLGKMADDLAKVEQNAHIANFGFKGMADNLENLGQKTQFSDEEMEQLQASFAFVGPTLDQAGAKVNKFADVLKGSLGGLNDIFQRAFEGGGGVAGAALSIATNLGKGLLNAIPVVGPFLSQFAGSIVAGLKKLFGGPSATELAGRGAEAEFQKQFGSFEAMMAAVGKAYADTGRNAAQAQADVLAMMNAEKMGAEATKAAIDKINQAFDDQKQDAADLDAAITKYGFSIEQLGPTLQKQRLDEQAKTLLNDWRLLVGSGIDVVTVDEKMASTMQAYLDTARNTGQEVPIALQPILQKMIEQGLLTDENGTKITDMGGLGVTFAETMTAGFDKVVAKLSELIAKIGGELPAALQRIPTSTNIDINLNGRWNIPDLPRDAVPGFASEAYVRRPTLAIVGDTPGGEFVLKPSTVQKLVDKAAALGAQAATGVASASGIDLEPLAREIGRLRSDFRNLSGSMERAVRDGLLGVR